MIRVIAATHNQGKIKEIRHILYPVDVISLSDIGFFEEIPETGKTFYENALLKASQIREHFKIIYPDAYILADDSGLEIEALHGRPGILSARYGGENSNFETKIMMVLSEMSEVPKKNRKARFVCSMVLLSPDGGIYHCEGYCIGRISETSRGSNGFGYDPIFLIKELGYRKTMAEIPDRLKNEISHRKKALDGIKKIIGKMEI